jgi:hypothetical protein
MSSRFRRAHFFKLSMIKDFTEYLRAHALELIQLARAATDPNLSTKLESMAVELLKRTLQFEKNNRL